MATLTEQQQLERFGELVLANRELHEQLRATADQATFVAFAVRLGAEHGCDFSAQVVLDTLNEKRRAWLERWL